MSTKLGLLTPFAARQRCQYVDWIPLQEIATDELLYGGHMIMGFTADGNFIMSYQKIVHGYESVYSLHFWQFGFRKKLVKVHSVPLFSSVLLREFLKLRISIHQTTDGLITVVGKCKSLYISVLRTPPLTGSACKQCFINRRRACVCHSSVLHFHLPNPASAAPITKEVVVPCSNTFVFRSAVSLVAIQVTNASSSSSPACQYGKLDTPDTSSRDHCCAGLLNKPKDSAAQSSLDRSTTSQRPYSACPVPHIYCNGPGVEAGTSSSLLSGQVHCYVGNPDALANQQCEGADYDTLTLRVLHSNGVPLLPADGAASSRLALMCRDFLRVAQHTVDLEEYIQYTMVHHPDLLERFRGISDYSLSMHVLGDAVIGSLAVVVERWDDDAVAAEELSPYDFDYCPGNPVRTRASSKYEGLIAFEWDTRKGWLRTLSVTIFPNDHWLKVADSGSADLGKFFSCRMLVRSELSLCELIKVSKPIEPPAMSNKNWFLRGDSVTHFKHPSLPVYVFLKK
eukprot:scpid60425/ scgid0515/ 